MRGPIVAMPFTNYLLFSHRVSLSPYTTDAVNCASFRWKRYFIAYSSLHFGNLVECNYEKVCLNYLIVMPRYERWCW